MERTLILLALGFAMCSAEPSLRPQSLNASLTACTNVWDCPSHTRCLDGVCVPHYGAEIDLPGCPCCKCEACVCDHLPECCSPDWYWDKHCVALCGGECGGFALDASQFDCTGKECGTDGCYGSCGSCGTGLTCVEGKCEACQPDCEGKECGSDGCGGLCGLCDSLVGEHCLTDLAPSVAQPKCVNWGSVRVPETGCCLSDSLVLERWGVETHCPTGKVCKWIPAEEGSYQEEGYGCEWHNADNCAKYYDPSLCADPETWSKSCCKESPNPEYPRECDFTPQPYCYEYSECGPDGVGGFCGACLDGQWCKGNLCRPCALDCDGKSCGPDGCGGSCGECSIGEICVTGQCVPKSGCGRVGDRGCCVGYRLVECLNGRLWESRCNSFEGTEQVENGGRCVWLKQPAPTDFQGRDWSLGQYEAIGMIEHYVCAVAENWTAVEHLTEEDPSGEYPRECDFTPCTRNCEGRSCGDDGCDGTCGGCGDHRDCVNFQCVDRLPEPVPDAWDDVADVVPDELEPPAEVIDHGGSEAIDPDAPQDGAVSDLSEDDAARTDVTADDASVPMPSPGCGCSVSATSPAPPDGPLLLLLLVIAAVWRVRRGKPHPRSR